MTSLFDKLNLRPQERRLVVVVGIVVFIVLNVWLVIPMFGEQSRYEQRIRDASVALKKFQEEIGKRSSYEKELGELEQRGGFVPTEEAALRLSQEVNSQAGLSGVTITSMTPMQRQATSGRTNAFFEEATLSVNINTSEKELVEFLYRLADKDLLIRARSMQLSPDPTRTRLQGQVTLVKSFQRRPPPKTAAPAARAASTPKAKPGNPAPAKSPAPARSVSNAAASAPPGRAPAPSGASTNRVQPAPLPAKAAKP